MTIYSYGVMLAVSVLVCTYLLSIDARRYNISQETAYDLVFWCMLWGIIGARIFYVFIEWSYFSDNLLEIPMLQKGGLAWQGGFLGGALAGVIRHIMPGFIRPNYLRQRASLLFF